MKREDKERNELLREYEQYDERCNNLQKTADLLKDLIKALERFPERAKQSEMDKKLLLIKELTWLNQMSKIPGNQDIVERQKADVEVEVTVRTHEENYEQLSLPGFEADSAETREIKKKVSINLFQENKYYRKVSPERTVNEILMDHSKQNLSDYNKYLGTGLQAKSSKETLVKGLEEWIMEHPLQLLLAISKSTVKFLRKLADMEVGANIAITEKNVDDCMQAILWGLLDAVIMYQEGKVFFGISVPDAVGERILPQLENITKERMEQNDIWCYFASNREKAPDEKELWDDINRFGDDIHLMLSQYGVLDVKTFHRLFVEIFQSELTEKQLMRFVYLWGTFHQRMRTGKMMTGKEIFVGNPEIDISSVIIKRTKYCKDTPYRCQSKDEILTQLSLIMEAWAVVGAAFEEWGLAEEEVEEIMLGGYCLVQEGQSVTDLMEYFFHNFEMDEQVDIVMLWKLLIGIGLGTPLPMLNGHSRLSYWQEYGTYRYLDLFKGTNKKVRKAALYELPVELQEQLAELIVISETADYEMLKAEEEKLPFPSRNNEQIKIYLAANRLAAYDRIPDGEKKEAAEKEIRKMILDLCEECRNEETSSKLLELANKHGIIQMVEERQPIYLNERDTDYFWDDKWTEPVVPIIKAEKVYPNDPCPCGSGKKFKKCCKGKGIYD